MTEEGNLTDTQVLKQQIAEGEFRSLIDVILDGVGRVLQKLIRRPEPPAAWVSALVIGLSISLLGLVASLLSGGVSRFGYRTLILGGSMIFLTIIIPRSTNTRTLKTLHDQVLDTLDTGEGIAGLHDWLTMIASRKWPILSSFLYVVLMFVYGTLFLETKDTPMDVAVVGIAMFIVSGMMIYYLLLFLFLPGRLGWCHYRLNAWDPMTTEVVSQLSGLFNYIAYMIAFLLASMTLFSVSLVTFDITNLLVMLPTWLVLIFIFVAGQMALTRIIKRAKRESLDEVEAQMTTLRIRGDPPDKETMETFMRTWDYHDRVKGTRNSVLNLKSVVNFVNTLLIPLLAFLVANRNEIFKFLGWTN